MVNSRLDIIFLLWYIIDILNRSNPKEKETFDSDEMLPLMRGHFLYKRGEGSVPGLKMQDLTLFL